ncbi:ATP-binding protein [Nonomuraea sp. CA-141351]|uniref:ATP-binding protein n=1 Tax=Nonomuraea sp. CA-141351 TaxID=3239996 RepID=UPI003D8C1172
MKRPQGNKRLHNSYPTFDLEIHVACCAIKIDKCDKAVIGMLSTTGLVELGISELTRNALALRLARQAVTAWIGRDHPAREAAMLAASELVTNAVKHADTGFDRRWVRIQLSRSEDFLRLAVTDPGSTVSVPYCIPPQLPSLNRRAENGRGLAIVATLSRGRWGSHILPQSAHRVVWCYLDTNPTEPDIELRFPALM